MAKSRGISVRSMQKSLSVVVGSGHRRMMIWKRKQEHDLHSWVLAEVAGHI